MSEHRGGVGAPGPDQDGPQDATGRRGERRTSVQRDDQIEIDDELVVVRSVAETPNGFELVVKSPIRGLVEVFFRANEEVGCLSRRF